MFKEIGIIPVKELYRGIYDEDIIKSIKINEDTQEGYVIRLTDSFKYSDFDISLAKYVRKNHVVTDTHWMNNKVKTNGIKKC